MLRNAVQRIVEGLSSNAEISIVDLVQTPGAAGDRRPDHRGDVPARGPRRRRDGQRRPGGHSHRGGDPGQVHRPPAGSGLRQGHPQAARPGRQDAAVPRRRGLLQDRDRPGRHGRAEQGLDLAQHPAHPGGDHRPRALAVAGPSEPSRSRHADCAPGVQGGRPPCERACCGHGAPRAGSGHAGRRPGRYGGADRRRRPSPGCLLGRTRLPRPGLRRPPGGHPGRPGSDRGGRRPRPAAGVGGRGRAGPGPARSAGVSPTSWSRP